MKVMSYLVEKGNIENTEAPRNDHIFLFYFLLKAMPEKEVNLDKKIPSSPVKALPFIWYVMR